MLKKLREAVHRKFNTNQRKVIANIGWLASERIFRMVVGFLTLAWTARYLGVDQFGSLNYALAFAAMFSPLFQLASDQITFRDLVNSPENKEKILGTSFLIKCVVGIVVFFLSVASILLLQGNDPLVAKLVIILATSSFFGGFGVIESWFHSQVELKYMIWARNSVFIVTTILRIAFLELKAPIELFAWLMVIESFLNMLGFVAVFKLTGNNILAWRPDWKLSKELMKLSFPLIFSTLAIVIYMRIDQVMLGQLAGSQSVGTYSAAVRLSEIWPFASTMIVKSLAPSIIAAKKISGESYYRKLQNLCNVQAILVYCVAIPMTFLSTPFVVLVFGQEYAPAGIILSIHIWSSMFLFLGYVKEIWITTEGITWFAFAFTVVGALMNVVLNFILIPPYKEVGAAVATVISYCFADYIMCFLYPSARRFGWMMTQAMSLSLIKSKI
ncbi:MAG TPA: flippase [Coleofasciculaceae cyanobacterium]|jgi:PST family polysaccharide transporter